MSIRLTIDVYSLTCDKTKKLRLFLLPPPSSTHLHSAPSTSIQLISASTQLSATPATLLEPKYWMWLGNFSTFRPKNSKLSVLTENWHTWYLGGANSKSGLRFLKFRPPKSLFGKIWANKVSVVPFNWKLAHVVSWDGDSYSNISFLNFQPCIRFWTNLGWKNQSCPFCLKIGTQGILEVLIPNSDLVAWNLELIFIFWQIWS